MKNLTDKVVQKWKDAHREAGVIAKVRIEDWRGEGAKPNTVNVGIEFKGSYQSFGGLMLSTIHLQEAFVDQLKAAFGVRDAKELIGKQCFALRAFSTWNSPIVGLESVDTGRKFTIRDFRISQGFEAKTEYEAEVERTERDIANMTQRIKEQQAKLKTLKADYVEW